MEDAGVLALIAIPIRGIIGYLIGRNRKIGGGWSAVLGILGNYSYCVRQLKFVRGNTSNSQRTEC